MNRPRWTIRGQLAGIAAVAALLAYGLTDWGGATNCGGNTEALWVVRCVADAIRAAATADRPLVLGDLSAERRERIADPATGASHGSAVYLISTLPYTEHLKPGPRRVLVACSRGFTNVPRRAWPGPPRHAVAYSDGTVALISADAFAALDRSTLRPAEALLGRTNPAGRR